MKNQSSFRKKINWKKCKRGFTLIEILVSVSIFLLAMTIVFEMFYASLRVQRRMVAHSQLINEMSYNLEHISRGVRMAKKSLPTDPPCLSTLSTNYERTAFGIKFQNPNAIVGGVDCVEYYVSAHPQNPAAKALMERRSNSVFSFDLPLTSSEIDIINFSVTMSGESQDDTLQPRVTLYIEAKNRENEIMKDQITISQRDLDIRE
jgi:prepilin-type N-terminal cleavage/methylation domain-containing protein